MFKLAFVNLALFLNLLHADVIQFGAANIENLPPRSVIGPSDFNAKTLKEYQGKPLSQFRTPILPISVPIKLLGPNRIDSATLSLEGRQHKGRYDFLKQQLVWLVHGPHIQNGLHFATISATTTTGRTYYKDISFHYTGSESKIKRQRAEGGISVSVTDPDGFHSIFVNNKNGEPIPPMRFSQRQVEHLFFVITGESPSPKVSIWTGRGLKMFHKQTLDLKHRLKQIPFVGSPQFIAAQTVANEELNHQCISGFCGSLPFSDDLALGALGSLRSAIHDALETNTPYLLELEGGLSETDIQKYETFLRLRSQRTGCTEEEKRQLQAQLNELQKRQNLLQQQKRQLETQYKNQLQQSQQNIKRAQAEWERRKQKRDQLLPELNRRKQALDRRRRNCRRFFSQLPGASKVPTGQTVGSGDNIKSPYGGTIHITDGNLFARSIARWRSEYEQCAKGIREYAQRYRQQNRQIQQAEAAMNQQKAKVKNLIQQQNQALREIQKWQQAVEKQLSTVETLIAKIQAELARCGVLIAEELERQKQAKKAQQLRLQREQELQRLRRAATLRRQRKARLASEERKRKQRLATRERQRQKQAQEQKKRNGQRLRTRVRPVPQLPTPINPSDDQLKFAAQSLFRELHLHSLAKYAPCHCINKALAAANNTNSIVSDILGQFAIDVAFAGFSGMNLSRAWQVGLGVAQAFGKYLFGANISKELATTIFSNIGGEILPKLVGNEYAGGKINDLLTGGLKKFLQEEGVRALQWEGEADTRYCGKVKAKTTMLFNPNTGWVALFIKVDNCPMVIIKYKVNKGGRHLGTPQAKILR